MVFKVTNFDLIFVQFATKHSEFSRRQRYLAKFAGNSWQHCAIWQLVAMSILFYASVVLVPYDWPSVCCDRKPWNMATLVTNASGHLQNQLTRSLERILEEANQSGELRLTNRKLKDFPKQCSNYDLSDTVIAGEISSFSLIYYCSMPCPDFNWKVVTLALVLRNLCVGLVSAIRRISVIFICKRICASQLFISPP